MELILMAFTAVAIITTPSMVFGCGVIIDTLSYGSALLKESLTFMGFTKHQWEITPKCALVRHPKDPLPPCRNSTELFQRSQNIIISLGSRRPFISDTPSALAHPIPWGPPYEGITLVDYFWGTGT